MTAEMEPPANPYGADLGDRDPLDALAETPHRIRELVGSWTNERLERSYAPGKWSVRQVLIHLAQTEVALSARARYALTQEAYTAQPFSPDAWMALDIGTPAEVALDLYTALRQMNLGMLRALSPEQRARRFTHTEYGTLTVMWIAAQLAGHDIHHLKQLAAME